MRDKKKRKHGGMKQKLCEERKRQERLGLVVTVAILIVIVSVSGFLIHSMLNSSPPEQDINSTSEPKAAIVDHLSLTMPNQTFMETATNTIEQAGFTVDYYQGEEVTVEFYRNLPTHGYKLIILRVHSTALSLFTSETYDKNKYFWEQWTDQLTRAKYFEEDEEAYFGITALFVRSSMNGRFDNSVIIMMGCLGLAVNDTAEAFVERGARVYISWNDFVLVSHTDTAVTCLLQHFLIEKLTLQKSVQETFKEVGFDPAYESLLIYYPLEAGDYTIQNILGNIITNNAWKLNVKHHIEKRKFAVF